MLEAKNILKKRIITFNSMQVFMLCISGADCIEDTRICSFENCSIDWVTVLLWVPRGIKVVSPDVVTARSPLQKKKLSATSVVKRNGKLTQAQAWHTS